MKNKKIIMYKCKECDYETRKLSEIANHYQYSHKENKKNICDKCGKEFLNEKGLKCHTPNSCQKEIERKSINHTCPKCGKYIPCNIQKHINSCGKKKEKKEKKPIYNKGLTYEYIFGFEKAKEIKNKISKKATGKSSTFEKEIERKNKISKSAKERGFGGYVRNSGRGKKGWYRGYWCDSSWELAWVIYNLEQNVKFERNTEKFKYVFDDKVRGYIPDFKIENTYIEIKGYFTKQFESKMKQFPNKLKIFGKEEMKPILEYVKNKYGNKFINLYENMGIV